ncbi:MAG: hypothetical protein HY648_09255 [Acidobacteria bacterium]|nr:hypothetical protein [Acidobacteriota bacterium]
MEKYLDFHAFCSLILHRDRVPAPFVKPAGASLAGIATTNLNVTDTRLRRYFQGEIFSALTGNGSLLTMETTKNVNNGHLASEMWRVPE